MTIIEGITRIQRRRFEQGTPAAMSARYAALYAKAMRDEAEAEAVGDYDRILAVIAAARALLPLVVKPEFWDGATEEERGLSIWRYHTDRSAAVEALRVALAALDGSDA